MDSKWLLLSFRLPAEPSRPRVAVWRRLQKLGAVNLEGGVWLLPYTESLAASLEEVVAEVRRHGGGAHTFVTVEMSPDEEEALRERYNRAREEEYAELLHECRKHLAHIERETEEQNFAFTEVEEVEEDLEKIRRWFAQIRERDVFGVPAARQVEEMLNKCGETLDGFMRKAYEVGAKGVEQ